MTDQAQRRPSVRRILLALAIALAAAAALALTLPLSNSLLGFYLWEDETVRLVVVDGRLYALDRGEHPEIDGFTYDDPEAAAANIAQWKKTHARTNIWSRHDANPTHHADPGHRWLESFDKVSLRESGARIEGLGLALPWIRVVTLEFDFGLEEPMSRLRARSLSLMGPDSAPVAYLRKHAWKPEIADRLAEGLSSYPRLEIEPRFLCIPIIQLTLLVLLSVSATLGVAWCRGRWGRRRPPPGPAEPATAG